MAKDQVEWVSLEDVMIAAERNFAPMGPELAGFVVFEAALKLREVGGGVLDPSNLAIGTGGHVALTAQPKRGDEVAATRTLRTMLGSLLEVCTSSTPALRQCAKRKEALPLGALLRELEGALIPLNRAASRRAVARVARATLEAIEDGRLEPVPASDGEQSDPPAVEVAVRPRSEPPPLPRVVRVEPPREVPALEATEAPSVQPREVVEICEVPVEVAQSAAPPSVQPVLETSEKPPATTDEDRTPFDAPAFAISDLAAALDSQGAGEIEIVSHLPPIVTSVPPSVTEATPGGGVYSLRFQPTPAPKNDRVAQLIESFEVSRRRDDPALARDIKAWIGIETATSAPPPVTVHVKLKAREEDDLAIEHEAPVVASEEGDLDSVAPRRRGLGVAVFALAAAAIALGVFASKPALLDGLIGKPLPPPGETNAPAPVVAAAPKIPVVCEATLSLDGAPAGAEVLRRIGATPVTVTMPMHVPMDLVATMEGHTPRRAHVDPSAAWQKEPTGARLDVPFALDATTEVKWPTASGVTPLRVASDAPRGLLRATSTPNGATVWAVVDPAAVSGIPCGGAVDLMIVPTAGATKPVRVEWSAFTGAPPRATIKL